VASPTESEYYTASNAVYNAATGTFTAPAGWSVLQTSPSSQLADGFAAVALRTPEGNTVIAYAGTVTGLGTYQKGSEEADGQILGGSTPQALTDAQSFAEQVESANPSSPIYVTGHSLGGAEAESACKALGSDCAGGETFGAPGLPGNTASGPSTLINVVDYGDPVGNYSSDASSPFASIAPSNSGHYGLVEMVGNPQNAQALTTAASDLNAAISDDAPNGSFYGEEGGSAYTTAAISLAAGNLQYHGIVNYGKDLSATSSVGTPAGAATSDPDASTEFMRLYGLDL